MASTDVPEPGTHPDGTRDHRQTNPMGWATLVVGVLGMAGVTVLAIAGGPEAATVLGTTTAAVCAVGGTLAAHRR